MLIGSVLLFISIIAGKISGKLGVPSLLIFLAVGMFAGSDGPGGIYFDDPHITQFLGIIALSVILFSGGLDTRWRSAKPAAIKAGALSTFGVLLTAAATGAFVVYFLHLSWLEGLLLGAIVSSTDAAAVFSVLRTKSLGLKNNLGHLLELESGSNDPMANVLTLSLIYLINSPETTAWGIAVFFLKQMLIGAALGLLLGRLMVVFFNKINLDSDGLYPVLMLAYVMFAYSATDFIGGNGFLAVYLSAIVIGNSNVIFKSRTMKFFDGLAWLAQIIMFLTLGLLVFPKQILPVIWSGLAVSLFLIFVSRPLGVLLSLLPFKMPFRDKIFISWVGLRGAVPIVFATYPLTYGVDGAQFIFNIVFFIVITSVIVQGTTLSFFAKLLKLDEPAKAAEHKEITLSEDVNSELIEYGITEKSPACGKKLSQLGLPSTTLVVLITRNREHLTPRGDTIIEQGDILYVMTDDNSAIGKLDERLK